MQTYAQVGTEQHISWIRRARATTHDAVRTNNLVALDNADAYADLDQPRARQLPHHMPNVPDVGARIEVRWGDEWFAGVCTSRRQGTNSNQQRATLHRIVYDAVNGWPSTSYWHDLNENTWRPEQ